MASSYDVNDIKVYYKSINNESSWQVYENTQGLVGENITIADIYNGVPRIVEATDHDPSDPDYNEDWYYYVGKYSVGGVLYDKWRCLQAPNQDEVFYLTNVIVNNSGTEYIAPDQVALPLVAIYNPTISTTLPKDTDGYVELPCPSEYAGSTSTLVNSARNSAGVVIGEVIKEGVAKVEITWNFLTIKQYSSIAQLFDTAFGGNFFNKVRFYDSVANDWIERIMYPNDRGFQVAQITLDRNTGKPIGYTGVSLHLIDTCKVVE